MLYNKNNLAVAKVASKNKEDHIELTGVYFTPKLTAATDSFQLVEVTTPKDYSVDDFPTINEGNKAIKNIEPFIVDAKQVLKIKIAKNKALPILENVAITHNNKRTAVLTSTDLESVTNTTLIKIEGKYPKYKEIIPTKKPTVSIKINAQYLIDVLKIVSDTSKSNTDDSTNSVMLHIRGDDDPIEIVSIGDNQIARGLVMPIHPS